MSVTPLIDKRQERVSAEIARLIGSGDIKAAMSEISALSERTDRLAKMRKPK